jgi:2-aminoethylphosphonate-pyruvate transaminase
MNFEQASVLLTPGPVQLERSVLSAIMGAGHLHHRMPEFLELVESSHRKLEQLFDIPADYDEIFLGCSGTGMVEAMLRNYHALGKGRVLCLVNGHFGSRLFNMASKLGMEPSCLTVAEGQHFDLEDLERFVLEQPDITAIAVVHLETSVGHVNALAVLSQYCEARELDLLVDMVSSLSGEPFTFADIRPSISVSVSGKAIGALPGIGIAFVREDISAQLKHSSMKEHYFSFANYIDAKARHRATPFTPPVHLFPALDRALQLTIDEGLESKLQRHKQGIQLLERMALSHGFEVQKAETPSYTTRTFHYDPRSHAKFDEFKSLLNRFHFVPLQNPITQRDKGQFQLSSMGYLPLSMLKKLESDLQSLVELECYA